MKNFFAFLIFIGLLGGCVSPYVPPPPPSSTPAAIKLAEAAVTTSRSLRNLEAMHKAMFPDLKKRLPAFNAPNMQQRVTVDWVGPIEPVVIHLATLSGYRVQILGNEPAIPVIVSLHKKDTSVAYVLRDIDYQAGSKAFVIVYTNRRTVELRYPRV